MSTLHPNHFQTMRPVASDATAKSMLQSINAILSQPLVITVKCENESCASILNVEVPASLEAAAPPRLVVRCASCASLLRVQLPDGIYTRHKAAQLEMLRACQQQYVGLQTPSSDVNINTPDQQPATGAALQGQDRSIQTS